jgi:hypothetical protein
MIGSLTMSFLDSGGARFTSRILTYSGLKIQLTRSRHFLWVSPVCFFLYAVDSRPSLQHNAFFYPNQSAANGRWQVPHCCYLWCYTLGCLLDIASTETLCSYCDESYDDFISTLFSCLCRQLLAFSSSWWCGEWARLKLVKFCIADQTHKQ